MSLPSDGMSSSSASGQLMTRFSVGVVCLSGGPPVYTTSSLMLCLISRSRQPDVLIFLACFTKLLSRGRTIITITIITC